MRTPPSETEQRIAEELGVELCDFCGFPRLLHAGFDHGKGRCLIDRTGAFMLHFNGLLSAKRKKEAIARIKEWDERVARAEEADCFMGSGI